jgi:uncharacterized surface protein with fasciclin (FAS1) repeats
MNLNKRALLHGGLIAVWAVLGGCATVSAPVSVTDTVARTPELSTLSRLINEAGLAETLRAAGPYTLFAPSDDAFKAVPAQTLAALAADKTLLKSVLSFHVLPSRSAAADVKNGNVKTVQGAELALSKAGSFVTVEDAMVMRADLPASNGVVHVIDRVLMPPKR